MRCILHCTRTPALLVFAVALGSMGTLPSGLTKPLDGQHAGTMFGAGPPLTCAAAVAGDVVLKDTYERCIKPEGAYSGHKLRKGDVLDLQVGRDGRAALANPTTSILATVRIMEGVALLSFESLSAFTGSGRPLLPAK